MLTRIKHRSESLEFKNDREAVRAWNDGAALFNKRKLAEALPIFARLATLGYPDACEVVGEIYERGDSQLPANLNEALSWYRRAVRSDPGPGASFNLARVLLKLDQRDADDAPALLEAAAREGHLPSKGLLGLLFETGIRTPVDRHRARTLYEEAASEGLVFAMHRLARFDKEDGRVWRSLTRRVQATIHGVRIALQDPADLRLWHMR